MSVVNGKNFEERIGRYVTWITLVLSIVVQATFMVAKLNQIAADVSSLRSAQAKADDLILILRLDQARREVIADDTRDRLKRIETRLEQLSGSLKGIRN